MNKLLLAAGLLLGVALGTTNCKKSDGGPMPAPQPVLSANFTPLSTPEAFTPTTFQNTSQNAVKYKWSFGDGSTSTTGYPNHTYIKIGAYTVRLVAYDVSQDSAIITKTVTVQVSAHDLFAQASTKILGNYNYSLVTVGYYNTPVSKTTQSKGILAVTQTGLSTINISRVSATTSFTYDPDPINPTIYRFHYDDNGGTILTRGSAQFYPTGDSLNIDLTTLIGLAGSESNTYRCQRRP